MKTLLHFALLLPLSLPLQAQPPEILHYGGTSFPAPNSTDSAFCKGQSIVRVVGTRFTDVAAGEVWDSTTLSLAWSAGAGGMRCPVAYLTDTLLVASLPDTFPDDARMVLSLTRHAHLGTLSMPATVTRTVQLTGDHLRIAYPPSPWCVGATNPLPAMRIGQGSVPGAFLSRSSNPGFVVQATSGEVLLHSGAVGSHAWVYVGGHPQCPDSVAFTGTILGRTSATLTYGGAVLLQWCQGDPPVSADRLQPAGGRFLADPGLHLSDDSLGTLVPALSLPRTYQLRYIPPQACADTAAVTVTILRAPTARIDLPAQACEGLPLQLDAVTLDAVAWVWMHNGLPAGGNPVLHLPDPDTGIPAGQEGDTLILTATTGQGCTAADTLRLHLSPRPDVQAIVAPKAVLEGMLPTYTAAASMDSAAIHWRLDVLPAMGEPYPLTAASAYAPTAGQAVPVEPYAMLPDHRTRAGERLRLILTATAPALSAGAGCTGEPDTTFTEVLQGTSPVFIPQAMTPDGNGINDNWEIRWTDTADPADYHIELFNRAGGKVLDMQPLHSHWDGGGLPDGVYWWVLKDRAGRVVAGDGLTIRRK